MSLAKPDFEQACRWLCSFTSKQDSYLSDLGIAATREGPKFYHERRVERPVVSEEPVNHDERETPEHDAECMTRPALPAQTAVRYEVEYSPSYQVPVLYFSLVENGRPRYPPVEQVKDLLVPASSKAQLTNDQGPGSLGMLTLSDHSEAWGSPRYMVHPCRTQEVMSQLVGSEKCSPERYMLLWLGMVGPTVGLTIPLSIMQQMQQAPELSLQTAGQEDRQR